MGRLQAVLRAFALTAAGPAEVRRAPAPLLVDGEARYLRGGRSLPLGLRQAHRPPGEVVVTPHSLLIWCTDGLVERRDDEIDAGLDRLAALARSVPADPGAACDRVVELMTGGPVGTTSGAERPHLRRSGIGRSADLSAETRVRPDVGYGYPVRR